MTTQLALMGSTALALADIEIDAEEAAQNAFADEGTKVADSLQSRAAKASLHALAKTDAWSRKAALSLGLTLCAEQIRETLTGMEYGAEKDAFVFRKVVLFPAALAGAMIFENTETEVAAIRAAKPNSDERKALARAYIMRKQTKDTGLVSSFKTQRTVGFRLAAWVRLNAKAKLINVARLSMSSLDKAEEAWDVLVSENFGNTFDRMASKLKAWDDARKPAKAPRSGKGESVKGDTVDAAERAAQDAAHARRDPVAAIMAQVEALDGTQLASLLHRLKAHCADRETDAAEAAPAEAAPAVIALLPPAKAA